MRDTKRTRLVLSVLLVLSLSIIILNLRGEGSGPRSVADGVLGPIESAATAIVRPVRSLVESLSTIGSKDATIESLQAENDRLRSEQAASEYIRSRAAQLDALLAIAGLGQFKTVPAQVIGFGQSQGFGATVMLDAGQVDGIKPEMTVLNGRGLVGKVVSVAKDTSVVVLIVDPTSTVGARLEGTDALGLLSGTGDLTALQLVLLDPRTQVSVGDRLVKWANTGSPFAAGLPLGTVSAVGTAPSGARTAVVAPYVDFSALDLVGIVVAAPRSDPRDALLPPKPSPAPAPSTSSTG